MTEQQQTIEIYRQVTSEDLERRDTQRQTILELLQSHAFVPIEQFILDEGIYSYRTRISELRLGKHNGVRYNIDSCKETNENGENVWGYRLEM